METKISNKLLTVSSDILRVVEERDEISNGDFQACIEAQVIIAYQVGVLEQLNKDEKLFKGLKKYFEKIKV